MVYKINKAIAKINIAKIKALKKKGYTTITGSGGTKYSLTKKTAMKRIGRISKKWKNKYIIKPIKAKAAFGKNMGKQSYFFVAKKRRK